MNKQSVKYMLEALGTLPIEANIIRKVSKAVVLATTSVIQGVLDGKAPA